MKKRMTKLTKANVEELRAVLAEVRRGLQDLIAKDKEAAQTKEAH